MQYKLQATNGEWLYGGYLCRHMHEAQGLIEEAYASDEVDAQDGVDVYRVNDDGVAETRPCRFFGYDDFYFEE